MEDYREKIERYISMEKEVLDLLSPDEINSVLIQYKEAAAQCRIPQGSKDDIERYKKQLTEAYAC